MRKLDGRIGRAIATAIVPALGEVDILVASAEKETTTPVDTMPAALVDGMIRVHTTGTFARGRKVVPAMKRQGWGRIMNLSYQLAHKGGATMVDRSTAKAGVIGSTKALALKVAAFGVTANRINPGPIETPLLRSISRDCLDAQQCQLPIGRFGRVAEIAPAALLLDTDEGGYVVGATV